MNLDFHSVVERFSESKFQLSVRNERFFPLVNEEQQLVATVLKSKARFVRRGEDTEAQPKPRLIALKPPSE